MRHSLSSQAKQGLLPTPTASDADSSGSRNTPNSKANAGVSLTDWARQDGGKGRLMPTPRAEDSQSCGLHPGKMDNLTGVARLLPTPSARDHRSDSSKQTDKELYGTKERPLPRVVGGLLNPQFVELIMLFPSGWTELDV